jgi:hypothetical protein
MPTGRDNDDACNAFDNGLRTRAAPKYSITHGEDDTFQWQPPIKSRELANALSYHYPLEQSLQEKMRRAILDFLDSKIVYGMRTPKEVKTDLKLLAAVQPPKLITSRIRLRQTSPSRQKRQRTRPRAVKVRKCAGSGMPRRVKQPNQKDERAGSVQPHGSELPRTEEMLVHIIRRPRPR